MSHGTRIYFDTWHEATAAQQGIWALDRIEQLRPAYLVPSILEFSGPVDHDLMLAAVRRAVGRHPALRSRFRLNVKRHRVEYSTDAESPDVRFWTADDWPREELRRCVHEFSYAPFDLAAGPCARADVVRVGALTTLLVLTVHHIVFDGWSRRLLVAEIAAIYQAGLRGREPELAEPVHPSKVLIAQPRAAMAERIASVVERLRGTPVGVELPYDRLPVDDSPLVSAVTATRFDTSLTSEMMAAARHEGCTAFMLAVAILTATLARAGTQRDFLFAVVWPGREDPTSHGVVGMFMNTVLLRIGLDDRTTWRDLLNHARVAALDAFMDGDVPLNAVVAALDKNRDVSRQPLTPVLINMAAARPPFEFAPGVDCRYQGLDLMYSKWDMAIFVQLDRGPDGKEKLGLTLDYPARLFDQSTIDNLILKLRDSAIHVIDHAENPVLDPSSDIDLSDPSVRLEVVRSAWQEVLGTTEIDDDTGFFDVGGDSLLLVALVEQLSKASGRMLKTMEVFRAGCIQNQAALLA
jgi:hypothetical protein